MFFLLFIRRVNFLENMHLNVYIFTAKFRTNKIL